MPSIFEFRGYKIYFWANENNEPVHVYISKGKPSRNSSKVWLTGSGGAIICNNKSKIPKDDLSEVISAIVSNSNLICSLWVELFGSIKFYA